MPLTISRSGGESFSYSTLRQRFGESEPRNARRIGLRGQSSRMTVWTDGAMCRCLPRSSFETPGSRCGCPKLKLSFIVDM